ncbi:unnamed protein product, partial [Ilex paraguariensis]
YSAAAGTIKGGMKKTHLEAAKIGGRFTVPSSVSVDKNGVFNVDTESFDLLIEELREYDDVSYVSESSAMEVVGVGIFDKENDKRIVESASKNGKSENALMVPLIAISCDNDYAKARV